MTQTQTDLTALEIEVLACLPGPSSTKGAFVEEIAADVFDAPVYSAKLTHPGDPIMSVRHAIQSLRRKVQRRVHAAPIEAVHCARAKVGTLSTMGYRLSAEGYKFAKTSLA